MTSVAASPEMMQKWVETIVAQDQKNKSRSVKLYILDNEPALWNDTHRDVHPDPLTYDELLDRTIRYGTAIRNADPQALIAGPAEWGWTGYFYSAKDAEAGVTLRPDRRAHGDVPLLPWYLKQLREHDRTTGKRVLDVLDVHFYPQGNGVYSGNADPATAALRLRSTRALVGPELQGRVVDRRARAPAAAAEGMGPAELPGPGDLDRRVQLRRRAAHERRAGARGSLGRFGTEGIDYAFYWFEPPPNSPVYWAFRAFRNFDGQERAIPEPLGRHTHGAERVALRVTRRFGQAHGADRAQPRPDDQRQGDHCPRTSAGQW